MRYFPKTGYWPVVGLNKMAGFHLMALCIAITISSNEDSLIFYSGKMNFSIIGFMRGENFMQLYCSLQRIVLTGCCVLRTEYCLEFWS
jgi:hypothetical protein